MFDSEININKELSLPVYRVIVCNTYNQNTSLCTYIYSTNYVFSYVCNYYIFYTNKTCGGHLYSCVVNTLSIVGTIHVMITVSIVVAAAPCNY